MSKNTKLRGLAWLSLAVLVIVVVGSTSYRGQATNLDVLEIFESKTEAQVGLEFLEIFSTHYEERPIIFETRENYSFSVHRVVQSTNTVNTDLYVYFRGLDFIEVDGVARPDIGYLDAFVYCSREANAFFQQISSVDLKQIAGTNVVAGFMSLPRETINRCDSNEFVFVVDTPELLQPGQDPKENIEVLEQISLSALYDLKEVATAAAMLDAVAMNEGFGGDINTSSYNTYSLQRAFLNAALSTPLVLPLAYGLWYATEKELFGEVVRLKTLKQNKKKNGK